MELRVYGERSGRVSYLGVLVLEDPADLSRELALALSLDPQVAEEVREVWLEGDLALKVDKLAYELEVKPLATRVGELRQRAVFEASAREELSDLLEELGASSRPRLRGDREEDFNDSYSVGPYSVRVRPPPRGDLEALYEVRPFSSRIEIGLACRALSRAVVEFDRKYFLRKIAESSLEEIVDHRLGYASDLVEGYSPDLRRACSRGDLERLSYLFVFRSLKMHRVMPFLMDDKVLEFFQDCPSTPIYLDHEDYGRCVSNVKLTAEELEALANHVRMDTGCILSKDSPSLKTDYTTRFFKVRISIDAPPLAVDGLSIDVRKHRLRPMTLGELVRRGAISTEAAAYLLLAAAFRMNILIAGEPGSGKTTLMNAVDVLLPRFFRKVYVEDVVESIPQLREGCHQLRLRVAAYESSGARFSKESEVVKLLHRKPDYVILGELQTREHVTAALHAMSAGLRCVQTTHARDLEQLVARFVDVYGVPAPLLYGIDGVVFTRRLLYKRDEKEVYRIYERKSGRREFELVFDRRGGSLVRLVGIEESSVVERIAEENGLPKKTLAMLARELERAIESERGREAVAKLLSEAAGGRHGGA